MIFEPIGTFYKPTGKMLKDPEGNEYPEMKPMDGYWVIALDLTDEDKEKLAPYIVELEKPPVKFAGRDDTVYLKFSSREEWLSLGYEKVEEGL